MENLGLVMVKSKAACAEGSSACQRVNGLCVIGGHGCCAGNGDQ